MTAGVPAIYGADLTEPVRLAYGAWITALMHRTEHGLLCPFGCRSGDERCLEGRALAGAEHEAWVAWRAAYREVEHA